MPNSPSISLLRNFIDGYKSCYCCTTVILMKSQMCRKKKKAITWVLKTSQLPIYWPTGQMLEQWVYENSVRTHLPTGEFWFIMSNCGRLQMPKNIHWDEKTNSFFSANTVLHTSFLYEELVVRTVIQETILNKYILKVIRKMVHELLCWIHQVIPQGKF